MTRKYFKTNLKVLDEFKSIYAVSSENEKSKIFLKLKLNEEQNKKKIDKIERHPEQWNIHNQLVRKQKRKPFCRRTAFSQRK